MKAIHLIVMFCIVFLGAGQAARADDGRWLIDYTQKQTDKWVNLVRPLDAGELDNRLILLDFWTFCCINCIQALPVLNEIRQDYHDKVTIIGVHSGKFGNEKTEVPIKRAIGRYQINHAVFNDADFSIWKNYEVQGWPTLILFSPDGKEIWRHFGEAPYDQISKALDDAVEKYGANARTDSLPIETIEREAVDSPYYYPSKMIALDQGQYALSDSGNNQIVILDNKGKAIKRYDGFNAPQGMAFDADKQRLYVADTGNHQIKLIDLKKGKIKRIAGLGKRGQPLSQKRQKAKKVNLASPWDITFFNGKLVIANAGTHQLLSLDVKAGKVSALAGNGKEYIDDGLFPNNSLSQPSALVVLGEYLYFLDAETSSLRRIDKQGNVETLVGTGLFDYGSKDGVKKDALMQHPLGLAADVKRNRLFIADSYNHVIRLYDVKTGYLQTISGRAEQHGEGELSADKLQYHEPNDLLLKSDGSLIVIDTNNHRLLSLNPFQGTVSLF